jgi:dihydroxyacetone kinase
LSASVAGSVFASPGAEQVGRGIDLVNNGSGKGVCVIIMNYTGDVLNFGMAVEKAKSRGVNVDMVIVGDDVGVGRKQGGKVGRRGIAGTCLVLKIAGALASTGASLDEVSKTAKLVAENLVSVGASLSHVHVPGHPSDENVDTLKENEVELGMGIHNEAGSERLSDTKLPALVKKMLAQMLNTEDTDRAFLKVSREDETVLMINNLGGVSPLELGGITEEVAVQLESSYSIKPVRIVSGTFMTSLNGLGFSISLLKITDTGLGKGKGMVELLDGPAEAVGWPGSINTSTWTAKKDETVFKTEKTKDPEQSPSNFRRGSLNCALQALDC